MMNNRRNVIAGAIAICISATLWGFDGIVLTPRLYNLDIGYVVFMLHLIPFFLMNIFLHREYREMKHFTQADYLGLFLVALFGGALGTLAIVKALFLLNFQKLTIVVLLQKLQPVFAILLAVIILKEKLRKRFILWASIAIVASYFVTFGFKTPNLGNGANTVYASLFALLAAFSFGSATVLGKKVLHNIHFTTATFYRYGFTTLIMLVYVLLTGKIQQMNVTTGFNWLIFIIIGLTTGSGAIFLYYYGLKKVKAIVATICELCFPLSAILFDYIFNNTQLTITQWISAAVLIYAIVNLNLPSRQKERE
ncbi:MAG: DMT family transporter [Bacteroidales bacterium]|nr:DMT family transporter [Bacteroidales bacterium]